MATIPPYLPDPFARAAWHMRNAHPEGHQRFKFWRTLADFLESAGHELALAGGNPLACDSPPSIELAENLAVLYLDALSEFEQTLIPQDLHS